MTVDEIIDATIGREGKYSNQPDDKGGPTMWGITQHVARAYGYTGDMQAMPRDTAVSIYRARFWSQPGFESINSISPTIAAKLFDIGVNMGQGTAGRFLQRALNVLNQQGKSYPAVATDGAIGPLTKSALMTFLGERGVEGERELLEMIRAQQRVRFMELAEQDASQETFEFGWQVRAEA